MSDVKGHDSSYEWKIILLLSITFGLVGLDRFVLPIILQSPNSTMGKDLGLTPQDGGTLAGYLGMAWGVSAFVMGYMADKVGRHAVLVPAILVFSLMSAFSGLAGSITALVIVRVIMGIALFFDAFDALAIASVLPVVAPLWKLTQPQIGLLISAGFLGQLVGALVFGWLAERHGRMLAMVWSIALFAVMSLICAFAWDYNSFFVMRTIQGFGLGGEVPVAADMAALVTNTVGGAFRVGIQLAAPFLVFGLVFNVALGVLSRLMPQMQVYFVAVPLSIMIGFLILLIVVGAMMGSFLTYVGGVLRLLAPYS